jgi:hypothetical protein
MANESLKLQGQSNKQPFAGCHKVNPFPEGKKAEGILQEQNSFTLLRQHYII